MFKLDPLVIPNGVAILWTPHSYTHAFPTQMAQLILFYFFLKNDFQNFLESPLIFVLFLKGKQNKKENSKYDSWRKDEYMKNWV